MLVSAALLPNPPVLVPEVAAGAAHELAGLRAACAQALDAVLAASPDVVIVIGDGNVRASCPAGSTGTFAGFGVPLEVRLPGVSTTSVAADGASDGDGDGELSLSLKVAAWLMEQCGPWPAARGEAIPRSMGADEASALGRGFSVEADRVAIVAMGDGSAAMSVKAPAHLVEGAAEWQRTVTKALGHADLAAIAAITAADADLFAAAGRQSWQVLAGAAQDVGRDAGQGGTWRAELLADEAPYGVGYVVAAWAGDQG